MDINNGGMKLAQLSNQASLHMTTVKLKKAVQIYIT
jgi:hypothetical protein